MNRNGELVNGGYYHIYNRGTEKKSVFTDKIEYQRAISLLSYYRYYDLSVRYSFFARFPLVEQNNKLDQLSLKSNKLVNIIAYCLMSNHFHLILQQNTDGGISKFMSNFQNSYTRFFNTKHNRIGPLFQGAYKVVMVENDEHLLQLSRYVHLNPVTSFVIKQDQLFQYRWSSINEYTSDNKLDHGICDKDPIQTQFTLADEYKKFLTEYVDASQQLHILKKLIFDET